MKEWTAFLNEHQKTVGQDAIDRWARTLKVLHFDAGNLYLEATDPFQLNWFEQYLRPLIQQSFQTNNGRAIRVHLTLAGPLANLAVAENKRAWKPALDLQPDLLLSNYTFETYFPGDTNALNLQLLAETLEKKTFNPIYIQGPSEAGKTHLLTATSHLIKQQGKSVFYVKADRFTQHIVAAIRSGSMPLLRNLYRKHDALILDEIETLADRAASQEELFHTFNALHLAGKQIVIAGRQLPSQLKGVEPRLTSRFEWGILLCFKPLTQLEQKTYFTTLLTQRKIFLDPPLIDECLSLLLTLPLLKRAAGILETRTQQACATSSLLHSWLSPLIQEQQKRALTPDAILQAVAHHFDIALADLQGRSQAHEHTFPRQMAMYLCRKQLHLPYMKIADLFSRDHSTVMTSIKLIEKRVHERCSIQDTLQAIVGKIQSSATPKR